MPGGDQTGPLGRGPMTDGGFGYCTGFAGRSPRYGRGRGYRHRFYATGVPFCAYYPASEPVFHPEDEAILLQKQADRLRSLLDDIDRRLQRLKGE